MILITSSSSSSISSYKQTSKQTMSTSINHFRSLLTQVVYSRRLLLHTPLYNPHTVGPAVPDPSPESVSAVGGSGGSSLDANVVMILAVLLSALICALGLNSIVRLVLRCSNRFALDYEPGRGPARLAGAGVRRKALRALPVAVYSAGLALPGSGSECAICLSDLLPGERIRVLPKCSHGFHVACVDRWLMNQPSCPTCRQRLFTVSEKSSGCGEANRVDPARSILVPLEPEGLISSYRGH